MTRYVVRLELGWVEYEVIADSASDAYWRASEWEHGCVGCDGERLEELQPFVGQLARGGHTWEAIEYEEVG